MAIASMSEPLTGQWDSSYHAPVLAEEVVALLGGARTVLDGTLGGGGHSLALLAGQQVRPSIEPRALSGASSFLAPHAGTPKLLLPLLRARTGAAACSP